MRKGGFLSWEVTHFSPSICLLPASCLSVKNSVGDYRETNKRHIQELVQEYAHRRASCPAEASVSKVSTYGWGTESQLKIHTNCTSRTQIQETFLDFFVCRQEKLVAHEFTTSSWVNSLYHTQKWLCWKGIKVAVGCLWSLLGVYQADLFRKMMSG